MHVLIIQSDIVNWIFAEALILNSFGGQAGRVCDENSHQNHGMWQRARHPLLSTTSKAPMLPSKSISGLAAAGPHSQHTFINSTPKGQLRVMCQMWSETTNEEHQGVWTQRFNSMTTCSSAFIQSSINNFLEFKRRVMRRFRKGATSVKMEMRIRAFFPSSQKLYPKH